MKLSSFDIYPKTLKEFRQRTLTGAFVSLLTATLIFTLTAIELYDYLQTHTANHLFVDTSRGEQQLRINLNITFPALPCSVVSLDTLDVSGNHAPELNRHIRVSRLDTHGNRLPDEMPMPHEHIEKVARMAGGGAAGTQRRLLALPGEGGAKKGGGGRPGELVTGNPNLLLSKLLEQLLPQIKEDQDAVAELQRHVGEGCHLEGHMRVRRVAGNFHFALTHADHHVLMSVFHDRSHLNLSHTIHSISFGEIDAPAAKVMHSNPLDGRVKMLHQGSGFFQYYIKVGSSRAKTYTPAIPPTPTTRNPTHPHPPAIPPTPPTRNPTHPQHPQSHPPQPPAIPPPHPPRNRPLPYPQAAHPLPATPPPHPLAAPRTP